MLTLLSLLEINSQSLWQKTYDFNNGNTDLCFKIIKTSKQKYILSGASTVPSQFSYGFDGIIMSLDQNGDTVWTKKLGSMGFGAQNDFLFDVIENDNQDLILTGVRKQGTQKQQLWIVKIQLNSNGNQIQSITEKQFGLSNKDDGGAKIIQNSDGTYFALGFTESKGAQQGGKDAWLLKLNANLDTLWTKTYDFGYSDEGSSIIPFQNGYLVAINSITGLINFPVPYYTSFTNVLYIDNNGNIQKQLTFNTDTLNSISNIRPTNDGGAVIVGSTNMNDNNLGGRDVFVIKLDSYANVVWTKIYGGYGKYDGGLDVIQSNDGTYYLCAYSQTYYTSNVDNWWLMRLKSNGDTLYTKFLVTLPDNDDPTSIIFSYDGKLIVAGWINANSNPANGWNMGNSNIHIMKIDTLFNTATSLEINSTESHQFFIYPNPSKNWLILKTNFPFRNASLVISDIYGQKIKEIDYLSNNEVLIQLENIKPGLYFITINQNNIPLYKQKVIISD